MLGDLADFDLLKSGVQRTAQYVSLLTFVRKATFGIGTSFSLFLVSQFGFEAKQAAYGGSALLGLRLSAFLGGGRPSVALSIRQFPFLVDKRRVTVLVEMDGQHVELPSVAHKTSHDTPIPATGVFAGESLAIDRSELIEVPLIALAWGRSGDKGDTSNIGIMARSPELLPVLRAQVTEASVAAYLAHLVRGTVTRYELPGLGALNFVCTQTLGGGGMASLRSDPLGKGMAQVLLSMPLKVSAALLTCTAPFKT